MVPALRGEIPKALEKRDHKQKEKINIPREV